MCGRYTLATPDPAQIRARFPVGESVALKRRFNVAPGDDVLAVTTDRSGAPHGELLRWGLVPSWAAVPNPRLSTINARVETVAVRPAFKGPFGRFRCLVVADGFYEWCARPGLPKQAFHITRADGGPFAFAGLWSLWKGHQGRSIRSCAILTTQANAAVATLHDRMPVILAEHDEAPWLDLATPRPRLLEMTRSLPAAETALRPVGAAVNDARYDGPECLAAAEDELSPSQAALF